MITDQFINAQIARALQNAPRGDSEDLTPGSVQRLLVRQLFADLDRVGRASGRGPVSAARLDAVKEAVAVSLGWEHKDGKWTHRADSSSHFPGELVDRGGEIIRSPQTPHAFVDALPQRNVNPAMELYQTRGIKYEGTASIKKPGDNTPPLVNYRAGATEGKMHTFWTSVVLPWEAAAYGVASDVDAVAESAEAAQRALFDQLESALLFGVAGVDFKSLKELQVNHTTSTVNYLSGSIADIYADQQSWIQGIHSASDRRGMRPNTLFISGDLADQMRKKSNLAAGGSYTGSELFAALAQSGEASIGMAYRAVGISRIVEIPGLDDWYKKGATYSGALAFNASAQGGLRKVVGLMPAPVRSVETIEGTQTVWVMRSGGLECADATNAGTFEAVARS